MPQLWLQCQHDPLFIHWLAKLAHLRVDRSRGIAPHKPLLVLVVLELIESQELLTPTLQLSPALAFRFY